MPRGHAKNEIEKSRKISLALLGNKNRLGQHWKLSPERLARGNKSWFRKGRTHPLKGISRLAYIGEKNPNWISDRTQLVKSEKKHLDSNYKIWMLAVKKRDGWKCKINNRDCKGRLESHHILNWKDYPELRYEINNGITLCHAHHPRGRENEAKLSPYFQNLVAEMK